MWPTGGTVVRTQRVVNDEWVFLTPGQGVRGIRMVTPVQGSKPLMVYLSTGYYDMDRGGTGHNLMWALRSDFHNFSEHIPFLPDDQIFFHNFSLWTGGIPAEFIFDVVQMDEPAPRVGQLFESECLVRQYLNSKEFRPNLCGLSIRLKGDQNIKGVTLTAGESVFEFKCTGAMWESGDLGRFNFSKCDSAVVDVKAEVQAEVQADVKARAEADTEYQMELLSINRFMANEIGCGLLLSL
jgi:hypothetical protein